MNVTPETSRADIERGVREFGYVGLKCYHFYAKGMDNTQDSEIDQYLTDEHCEAADALGLTVSLHMVKPLACSDPGNLANIRRLCTQYPKMNLILCHSARGFNMHHVIGVIDTLADLPNLYFDTGAVTEAGATNAILRSFGAQKVMYGSDWPVAESRGKCVSLGDSFIWLTPHNVDLFAK
jgi:glutamate-1-semialdehyde 2,1-aminomutase